MHADSFFGIYSRVKCLEFLYFWLYPESERRAAAAAAVARSQTPSTPAVPMTPTTPRRESARPRTSLTATAASSAPVPAPPHTPTDSRLRAMLESAHDAWTPTTPSKPSRTFEKTQLALSRSVAAAGMSPRKRPLHVSIGEHATETHEDDGSPRAKRSSLSQSASPAGGIMQPRPIRRVLPASPSARPRSILATSSARASSAANQTPPNTPRDGTPSAKVSSHARFVDAAEENQNHFKSPPKLLWSPSKPAYPSHSPALEAQHRMSSPALERQRSRDSPALERQRSSHSPALLERQRSTDSPAGLARNSSNEAKDAVRRRMSRSLMQPSSVGVKQPYRNLTELPGVSSETRGLFAPHASRSGTPSLPKEQVQEVAEDHLNEKGGVAKGDTYERRKQVLGQHIGNLDQLLHRFEVLRCR